MSSHCYPLGAGASPDLSVHPSPWGLVHPWLCVYSSAAAGEAEKSALSLTSAASGLSVLFFVYIQEAHCSHISCVWSLSACFPVLQDRAAQSGGPYGGTELLFAMSYFPVIGSASLGPRDQDDAESFCYVGFEVLGCPTMSSA